MRTTVELALARDTKGALRYEGVGDESPDSGRRLIGTLYLRKDRMRAELNSTTWPQRITVTVEA